MAVDGLICLDFIARLRQALHAPSSPLNSCSGVTGNLNGQEWVSYREGTDTVVTLIKPTPWSETSETKYIDILYDLKLQEIISLECAINYHLNI